MSKKQGSGRTGPLGFIAKMGSKLAGFAPKVFKVLKLGKVALAGASLASYTLIFSWQFAVVIVAVIFVHEYTHVLAMKRFRMRVRGMYFIPFLGAAAVPEDDFPDRKVEAVTAYAGPLTGLVLGLIGLGLFAFTHNGYVAAITGFTAFINLFNLLPISPLDGGRVIKSVAMSIGTRFGLGFMIAGLLFLMLAAYETKVLIFVILIPLGLIDFLYERRGERKRLADERQHDEGMKAEPGHELFDHKRPTVRTNLSRRAMLTVFGAYAGLAIALFAIMLAMQHEPGAAAALHVLQG